MPNIATVLKQEISRLARKEAKTLTEATRKANTRHRRDIAELKRQVQALSKQVAYLETRERKHASKPVVGASSNGRRFSASGLSSHRERLGLSAADVALLIGVSTQTIYNWENERSRPRPQQLDAIVAVRQMGRREALRRLEEEE